MKATLHWATCMHERLRSQAVADGGHVHVLAIDLDVCACLALARRLHRGIELSERFDARRHPDIAGQRSEWSARMLDIFFVQFSQILAQAPRVECKPAVQLTFTNVKACVCPPVELVVTIEDCPFATCCNWSDEMVTLCVWDCAVPLSPLTPAAGGAVSAASSRAKV
jgi:hypothetical protein